MSVNRAAVVTGSSRGIGRAVALRLAADGLAVVVNYRSDERAAKEVVDQILSQGGSAQPAQADVADPADLRSLLAASERYYGRLDVVVHNAAGVARGPLVDATDADFDLSFGMNTRSTFEVLRQAGRQLSDGGRIVFISSVATRFAPPEEALYAASKVAGEQLVRGFAREVGNRGITVNSVLPGPTATEGFGADPATAEALIARTPLGRLGQPADIADVVAFLASDAARWITGQSLAVDGGLS